MMKGVGGLLSWVLQYSIPGIFCIAAWDPRAPGVQLEHTCLKLPGFHIRLGTGAPGVSTRMRDT